MYFDDDVLVLSASDLGAFVHCEFATARTIDKRFGRDVQLHSDATSFLERARDLGYEHENRIAAELKAAGGFVEIQERKHSVANMRIAEEETIAALKNGAKTVFQGAFYDDNPTWVPDNFPIRVGFAGFSDFLTQDTAGIVQVLDAKLAKWAKGTALLQLALYYEQIRRVGLPANERVALLLGNGQRAEYRVRDASPVLEVQRKRLLDLVRQRAEQTGEDGDVASAEPIAWGTPGVRACLTCATCEYEMQASDDVGLTAGIRASQRLTLRDNGIVTLEKLAALRNDSAGIREVGEKTGIPESTLRDFAKQARVQEVSAGAQKPSIYVCDARILGALPTPRSNDVFLTVFEDSLYSAKQLGAQNGEIVWGIAYGIGVVTSDGQVKTFICATPQEEARALRDLLDWLWNMQADGSAANVYVFDGRTRRILESAAARHGLDKWFGYFTSRYGIVNIANIAADGMMLGAREITLDALSECAGITLGAEPEAFDARNLVLPYDTAPDSADNAQKLALRRDVESTLVSRCNATQAVRDWIYGLSAVYSGRYITAYGAAIIKPYLQTYKDLMVAPDQARKIAEILVSGELPNKIVHEAQIAEIEQETSSEADDNAAETVTTIKAEELIHIAQAQQDPARKEALLLLSAGLDYWMREKAQYRQYKETVLDAPAQAWQNNKDVFRSDPSASPLTPVSIANPVRGGRVIHMRGQISPGSGFKAGDSVYAIYDIPAQHRAPGQTKRRIAVNAAVQVVGDDGSMQIREATPLGWAQANNILPLAVIAGDPPREGKLPDSVRDLGEVVRDAAQGDINFTVKDARWQIFLSEEPVFATGETLAEINRRIAAANRGAEPRDLLTAQILEAVKLLDYSALAVQGPPGSGKSTLGAKLLKTLVEQQKWHIGVVGQSHNVVENLLNKTVETGLSADLVGKRLKRGTENDSRKFTVLTRNGQESKFHYEHLENGRGALVGGTAWTFANPAVYAEKQLDLLVVDEAGQYSLAMLAAAARAAKRVLLLGDPRQLPQVSSGLHPYPVNESALNWILAGAAVISDSHGYFLNESYRMHPAVCSVVSEMMYDQKLRAADTKNREYLQSDSRERSPGVIWHPVAHTGNTTSSPEEAAKIVELVSEFLQCEIVSPESSEKRTVTPEDIIIVAPYNAQVQEIEQALEKAGYRNVPVGTVDKFQGQEAQVCILSLAASNIADVARGVEFLLMPNRLNVAISRARWACHIVSSPDIRTGMPQSADGVVALSAYLRVLDAAKTDE